MVSFLTGYGGTVSQAVRRDGQEMQLDQGFYDCHYDAYEVSGKI
jgi:hypothetical protein